MPRNCAIHARPWASPKYRCAASSYSGAMPSIIWMLAVPRTISTLWGKGVVIDGNGKGHLRIQFQCLQLGSFRGAAHHKLLTGPMEPDRDHAWRPIQPYVGQPRRDTRAQQFLRDRV